MLLKDTCLKMLQDLENYKRPKSALLKLYLIKRLSDSVSSYVAELDKSSNYLDHRDNLNLLRKLSK